MSLEYRSSSRQYFAQVILVQTILVSSSWLATTSESLRTEITQDFSVSLSGVSLCNRLCPRPESPRHKPILVVFQFELPVSAHGGRSVGRQIFQIADLALA